MSLCLEHIGGHCEQGERGHVFVGLEGDINLDDGQSPQNTERSISVCMCMGEYTTITKLEKG